MPRTPSGTRSAGPLSPAPTTRAASSRSRVKPAAPSNSLKLRGEGSSKPSTTPPQDSINQWGYFAGPPPIFGWTVNDVSDVLAQHRAGNFSRSGMLAEDMSASPYISKCLNDLCEPLTTTPLIVQPAGRRGIRCADFVREVLPEIYPLSVRRDMIRNYLMMGEGLAAVDWYEVKDGADRFWLPRVKPWQPQLTYYQQFADSSSVDMGALIATTLNKGLVRVDPGESRWLKFSQSRLKPWLRGAVYVLAEAWLGYSYNFRDNQSFNDRFGRGIIKLHHPVSWKDEEILLAASSLRAGGGGGVMPCPTTPRGEHIVDVDLVQADGTGFKTFESTDKRVKELILIALLGQNMTSMGSTGGFAQARVHENSLWRRFESICADFGDAMLTCERSDETTVAGKVKRQWVPCDGVLRTQLTKWIAHWNFGDADLAPYVWQDCLAPEDDREQANDRAERAKIMASAMQSVGTMVEKLVAAGQVEGKDFDLDYLMEQAGVQLRRPVE